MEAIRATQPPSDSSAAAAPYPRWVTFSRSHDRKVECSYSSANVETLAAAHTSAGDRIGVSLHLAARPVTSRVRVHFPDGIGRRTVASAVFAAHGDSLLIEIQLLRSGGGQNSKVDYMFYSAGAAGTDTDRPRPPSLSLLPPCRFTVQTSGGASVRGGPEPRKLDHMATGLLRRGEDEFVVAELKKVKLQSLYLFGWTIHLGDEGRSPLSNAQVQLPARRSASRGRPAEAARPPGRPGLRSPGPTI